MKKPFRYVVVDDSAVLGMHKTLKQAKRTYAWGRADEKRSGYPPNPLMAIYELKK